MSDDQEEYMKALEAAKSLDVSIMEMDALMRFYSMGIQCRKQLVPEVADSLTEKGLIFGVPDKDSLGGLSYGLTDFGLIWLIGYLNGEIKRVEA